MLFGPRVPQIGTDELARELESGSGTLIDVREPEEFASGHVPGAINLPLATLPSSAAGIGCELEILVICQSGHRSKNASKRLLKAGFTNVRSVRGGTAAWRGKLDR